MKRKNFKQLFVTLMLSFVFVLFSNPMICMAEPRRVTQNPTNTTIQETSNPIKKSVLNLIPKTGDPIITVAICIGLISLVGVIICIIYKIRQKK